MRAGWSRLQLEERILILSLWHWKRTRHTISTFEELFFLISQKNVHQGRRIVWSVQEIYHPCVFAFFVRARLDCDQQNTQMPVPHPTHFQSWAPCAHPSQEERGSNSRASPSWDKDHFHLTLPVLFSGSIYCSIYSVCFFLRLFLLGQHLPKRLVARLRPRAKFSRLLQLISSRERHSCFQLRRGFATSPWAACVEINSPPGLRAGVVLVLPQLWFVKSWC